MPTQKLSKAVQKSLIEHAVKHTLKVRAERDPTVRQIIEDSWKELYTNLPSAVENIKKEVMSKGKEIAERKLRYEASKDLAQGAGLYGPSDKQSVFIQQTFNQNNLYLSPVIQGILDKHAKELTFDGEVIEDAVQVKEEEKGKEVNG